MQVSLSHEDSLRFFEFNPDICCIFDPDGSLLAANSAAEVTLGYSVTQLQHMPILELVHPDWKSFQNVLKGAQNEVEARFRTTTGLYRWPLWHAMAVDARLFATARDHRRKGPPG